MSRLTLAVLAAAALVACMAFAAPAAAAPVRLVGTVGPGHTIDLRLGGKKVMRLKAGIAYRLVVSDRSEDHDFRLVGPGTNRLITGEEFVGSKSVVLRLRAGTYRFFCAPHAGEMRGSFRVTR